MLKKYFKIYVHGFENASEWRDRLMETNSVDEALELAQGMVAEVKTGVVRPTHPPGGSA